MELIKRDATWFLSNAGCEAFAAATAPEDRAVFIYSYLKQVAPQDFDKDKTLFRIAFFFADAVLGSSLPYSTYPAVIDPEKNPFMAYVNNINHYPGAQTVYYVFLSILHGIAMPVKQNEWVYDKQIENAEHMKEKLTALGKRFCAGRTEMASADAFEIEESLQVVQLKLIWLMGQH